MSKRDVSATVNMSYPSCFRDGVTCLRHVSVCGFLLFRPVLMHYIVPNLTFTALNYDRTFTQNNDKQIASTFREFWHCCLTEIEVTSGPVKWMFRIKNWDT